MPASDPNTTPPTTRLTAWVHGRVQGVGFRWETRAKALELGLTGFASNYPDGRVLVVAEGSEDATDGLLAWLRSGRTPGHVEKVVEDITGPRGDYTGFDTR
ncbi:MAG: acylphosphatase [Corynebacterium sp.]|uniref:acylphosphatase n=1 Tax=Corynebacterium sp. TaxID=1720 RepID=UPI003F94E220